MKLISKGNDKVVVEFSEMEFMQIHSVTNAVLNEFDNIENEYVKMEKEEVEKLYNDLSETFDKIFD